MTRRYSGLWFLLQHRRIKKVCNTTKYFTSGMTFTRKMAREQIPFVFAFNFNQWSWWVCCLMSLWHQFSEYLCVNKYLFQPSDFWKHQLYVINIEFFPVLPKWSEQHWFVADHDHSLLKQNQNRTCMYSRVQHTWGTLTLLSLLSHFWLF